MRSCTLLCDSSRLFIYHKSEPKTPVLLESGVLGILVRAFPVLQHHRTYLLSYTPRVRDNTNKKKAVGLNEDKLMRYYVERRPSHLQITWAKNDLCRIK